MRVARIALAAVLVAGTVTSLEAQQDYASSTTPTSSNGFGAFPGSGWVVGQSFTASGGVLNAFGFYAASNWTGNATFQAFLYGMSGSSVIGSALYSSAVMSYGSITTGWFDFFTGGVSLSPGSVYMAILAPVTVTSGMAVMDLGTEAGDAYAGAAATYTWASLPVTDPALQAASWNTLGALTGTAGQDFALRLDWAVEGSGEEEILQPQGDPFDNMVAAPEPATMALLATGLVGLMGAGHLRRRRRA